MYWVLEPIDIDEPILLHRLATHTVQAGWDVAYSIQYNINVFDFSLNASDFVAVECPEHAEPFNPHPMT